MPASPHSFVLSPVFRCGGLCWTVKLYPGGYKGTIEDWTGKVAVILTPDKEEIKQSGRKAEWHFEVPNLLRPESSRRSAALRKDWEMMPNGDPPGRSQWLVERKEVLTEGSGFLTPDGALIIKLHMAVLTDDTQDTSTFTEKAVETKQGSAEKKALQDFAQLFEEGLHTDVTLRSGDVDIQAHKAILSARSPVFKAMFQHRMAELVEGVVRIDDIEPAVLRQLVAFLYSGKYVLDPAELAAAAPGGPGAASMEDEARVPRAVDHDWPCKIYLAAHRFQVATLIDLAEEVLCGSLTGESFVSRLMLAEQLDMGRLRARCCQYLRSDPRNVAAVMSSSSFRRLSKEQVVLVMACLTPDGQVPEDDKGGSSSLPRPIKQYRGL